MEEIENNTIINFNKKYNKSKFIHLYSNNSKFEMSSVSRSTLRSAGGGMYESETMRLQREVDTFTQKLEHEKRRLLIIEEQIK